GRARQWSRSTRLLVLVVRVRGPGGGKEIGGPGAEADIAVRLLQAARREDRSGARTRERRPARRVAPLLQRLRRAPGSGLTLRRSHPAFHQARPRRYDRNYLRRWHAEPRLHSR